MLAADAKRQEVRAKTHVSPPGLHPSLEAGLKLLYVRKVRVCDAVDGRC